MSSVNPWILICCKNGEPELREDDSQSKLPSFLGEDNADQLDIIMLDDTDCKVLHQARVSTAIPRLEVFRIHWKYVLQGVGGSGKENRPSIIRGFDMSDLPGPLETMG